MWTWDGPEALDCAHNSLASVPGRSSFPPLCFPAPYFPGLPHPHPAGKKPWRRSQVEAGRCPGGGSACALGVRIPERDDHSGKVGLHVTPTCIRLSVTLTSTPDSVLPGPHLPSTPPPETITNHRACAGADPTPREAGPESGRRGGIRRPGLGSTVGKRAEVTCPQGAQSRFLFRNPSCGRWIDRIGHRGPRDSKR